MSFDNSNGLARYGALIFAICACTESVTRGAMSKDAATDLAREPTESEAESAGTDAGVAAIICEEQEYTPEQFQTAFESASAELTALGHPVTPLLWEDEEWFWQLADHMVVALGCTPQDVYDAEQSSRRNGPGQCRPVTDLTTEQAGALYCGPGAWTGSWRACPGHHLLANPGSCLNTVCYDHDKCYRDLVAARGPVCIWSDETTACDGAFYRGALQCFVNRQCVFRFDCDFISAIAVGLRSTQGVADAVDYCLYGNDCPAGRGDCDGNRANRCETHLLTDRAHCGDCGNSCGARPEDTCVDATTRRNYGATQCVEGICNYPFTDTFCDDNNPCTGGDSCFGAGLCLALPLTCECTDGEERPCGAGDGECQSGVQRCVNTAWGSCEGAVGPVAEVCDGRDNDCDGAVDNGVRNACGGCGPVPTEICNGMDDDCDGAADEGSVCSGWVLTSTVDAPIPRYHHTAIWTGSEMIIWAGDTVYSGTTNTGARYNPTIDTWVSMTTVDAPSPRYLYTAVWTGSRMIVWGGYTMRYGPKLNTGGSYDPVSDTWTALPTDGAPDARGYHTAVWTGSEMIVWGGTDAMYGSVISVNTGGKYDPLTNLWTPTSTDFVYANQGHAAVWTGSEMITWGWSDSSGARYNPVTDTWRFTSTMDAPSARGGSTAIWTSSEMVVWGGYYYDRSGVNGVSTGGGYDPVSDAWAVVSSVPDGLGLFGGEGQTAVWTGSEMIIWGGYSLGGYLLLLNDGGRYNPDTGAWSDITRDGTPESRKYHTAVWTGSEMIVWGGDYFDAPLNTGGRYTPP